MPKKLDECIKQVMKRGKDKDAAYAICTEALKDTAVTDAEFTDCVLYDKESKSFISARDGVQEYYGAEIGKEPADRKFTVYRHPDTVQEAASAVLGLPITEEHVKVEGPVTNPIGSVSESETVDCVDESTGTTIAIRNRADLTEEMKRAIMDGKRQLSLGYRADLIPCEKYDFEQIDIIPHHVAIVRAARCGETCSFKDNQKEEGYEMKINKAFLDAEGNLNIRQVMELVQNLPEAVQQVGIEELSKMVPTLKEIIEMAKQAGAVSEEDEPAEDAEPEEDEEDKTPMADTQEFKDAVETVRKEYAYVINKAKDFLDGSYDFSKRDAETIMRDALKTQHDDTFEDSELRTAFKLLKKDKKYQNFGDQTGQTGKLTDLEEKEI